ncbi:MAG: beta-N-acetylhexosaminidase [Bacteroidales bacterium]|nr:beta-N-acetylhexosaminidase [Bacteroidales bacterium]
MMKNLRLLALLLTLLSSISTWAAGTMPQTSTADAPVWYMIKFMTGGGVVEAQSNGKKVLVGAQAINDAQYWRIEGNASTGYTFICREGNMTLYTDNTQRDGMFYAGISPNSNTKFNIKTSTYSGLADGFTISPKSNSNVWMNQWTGAGVGHEIGLWNSVDQNCPVQFISEAEVEEGLKLASLPLIPMPKDVQLLNGYALMKNFTTVAYADEKHKTLAEMYAEMLGAISGQQMSAVQGTSGSVTLSIDASLADEAYTLTVEAGGAVITAATKHGLFNALQTLRQLFYDAKYNGEFVQAINIKDEPRFEYRGFMLDIARHFFDKDEVKKLLDVMAIYKINKFHWHLTDDQGWRIEIPEYPLLTEIGAVRNSSNTKTSPRFYDDTEYGRGMYYTLDDLREIVAYAQKLHIDIMPEVDLPGHMIAAIASYPDEFCCVKPGIDDENKEQFTVRIKEGISKDVLNVAKPEVMDFLYCVLGHVAEVFPYPVIHIGGDECPKDAWNKLISDGDKLFKTWMSDNALTSADQIQPWLVNELGIWLKEKYGKDVVCWNELVDHWKTSYATKPIIMCYNGDGKSPMQKAANLGLRTIYTGCWPFYLDMYQTYKSDYNNAAAHQFDDPYTGGYGNNTLQRVYEATPTSSISGKENLCLGVGANLWTETVNNNRETEHQFFPRMLALAEVGWLPQNQKNWMSFRQRVQHHFSILDEYGIQYATYDKDEEPLPATAFYEDILEAHRLLTDAHPDAVGYPAAGVYETLRTALSNYENGHFGKDGEALHKAVADFKTAPVCQPEADKLYRIVSASVAWSRDYAGSTLYVTSDQKRLRFHYTPQTEPEELFTFVPAGSSADDEPSYRIVARLGEKKVYLGTLDAQASASTTGSVVRIDAATVGSTNPVYYDYMPGVVLISNKNGYTPDGAKSKRLNAQPDGYTYVKADATVGHTGCWRIIEVTNYAAELEALIDKCGRLGILIEELVVPARSFLDGISNPADVSIDDYDRFAALYAEHLKLKYTPTGVTSIPYESATTSAAYDLQGRPTNHSEGITISGAKKVVR